MKRPLTFVLAMFSAGCILAQSPTSPTPSKDRLEGIARRKALQESSLFTNLKFRNVGPVIMSGRAVDVDVNPEDPTEFYVAYASGGLWHTTNNGQSFTSLFDHEDVLTIGDIAVDWKSRAIWVGTGEVNSSRSSYSGTGVYLSTDSGKTWMYRGLPESHHIGRICLHPSQPGTAWVAVLGHLYSPNKERGVYKTVDSGTTWKQVLEIDENTGAVDLCVDPSNPDILYTSAWHRERRAWNFTGSGSTSGIYKSSDGGEHWYLLTDKNSGFPVGNGVGRIGLAIYPKNPNILYAVLDNQDKREDDTPVDTTVITAKDLKEITKEAFLKLDSKKLDAFLKENGFPEKYTADIVKGLIRTDSIKASAMTDYLNDANNSLFDSPVKGAEIYRSEDAGKSWVKTHEKPIKNLFYTYGYYFGRITVSPFDDKKIVVCGVPLIMSVDGGKTFKTIDGDNTHGDHHCVWMDSRKDKHMIICNDGGLNITYDDGANWFKANTPPVGQFYSVNVDMEKPYNVYGGLQDNGVWTGSSSTTNTSSWLQEGQYPYRFIMGGDGMQVQVDTRDNATVYTGFQFGCYYRINKNSPDNSTDVKPRNDLGEPNYRFNWQTPIWLSRHNQDILYSGSNRFHRSLTRGENIKTLSPDLTHHDKQGNVPFNTITTLCESPLRFGMIYAGTDDGFLWISKDAGYTWNKISDALPQDLYISRVTASLHHEGRVYVSLNGYRYDNFSPYIFRSEDEGKTWESISSNLPAEPVNVIKEDTKNENILYAGTDNGLYISLNRGQSWMTMGGDLPRVAVHDLVEHPRDNELVVGTHGRSIYIADLTEVQLLNDSILKTDLFVFDPQAPAFNKSWGKKFDDFSDPINPSVRIAYYAAGGGEVTVKFFSSKNILLKTIKDTAEAGLNYLLYDLTMEASSVKAFEKSAATKGKSGTVIQAEDKKYYLVPGNYSLEIINSKGTRVVKKFDVKEKNERGGEPAPVGSESDSQLRK